MGLNIHNTNYLLTIKRPNFYLITEEGIVHVAVQWQLFGIILSDYHG